MIKVTALSGSPRIIKPRTTYSVGVDTIMHYELELNAEINCGDFAEFLDEVMNTKEFKKRVKIYREGDGK